MNLLFDQTNIIPSQKHQPTRTHASS